MAVTCRNSPNHAPAAAVLAHLSVAAIALCVGPAALSAALDSQEPLRHSADAVTADFRSDTLNLTGNVRVTQGGMSIESETATGVGVGAENSRWTFDKSVHLRTPEAELQADTATATMVNGEIANARIEGSPARFEQRAITNERPVQGRAGTIEYDFTRGVVRLAEDVWFSNGKDEFRGDVVIYDVRDERVQINPAGQARGRVRGIIRPEKTEATSSGSGSSRGSAPQPIPPKPDEHAVTQPSAAPPEPGA